MDGFPFSIGTADVVCSGMIVFKLERERLPCVAYRDTLYYIKDRYVRCYEFKTQKDNPIISIRRPGTLGAGSSYRALSYNPAEHAILLTGDADGGSFELYQLPKDMSRGETSPVSVPLMGLHPTGRYASRTPRQDWELRLYLLPVIASLSWTRHTTRFRFAIYRTRSPRRLLLHAASPLRSSTRVPDRYWCTPKTK